VSGGLGQRLLSVGGDQPARQVCIHT
jgi:hypothetical protein